MRVTLPVRLLLSLVSLLSLAGCGGPSAAEHVAKGDAFVEQKKTAEASIEYRAALQADPNLGEVRLKLGNLYFQSNQLAPALREYVRAADLLPQNAEAQIKAGNMLLVAGQFQDAKVRATKATELDPKSVDAQILLGNTLAGLKDVEGALAEYQKALLLSPTEEVAYRNIATLQFSQGQVAEAERAFRKAVEVAPKSVPARLAVANLLWATGRVPEAEQTLKETLALDPDNEVANRALGTFYIGSKRVADAEPYFQAIARTKKTTDSTLSLADYYIFAKRYEDARAILKPLAADKEAYANATLRLAAIDVALGVRAEAEVKLQQILQTHPKEMAARLLLARLLVIDGKRDEAVTMAASIAKDEPSSSIAADAQALVGAVQASLDRPEDAIAAFEDVLKRRPRTIGAELALARLHVMQGNIDKADKYVSDALSTDPKNPAARAERVRVLIARRNLTAAKQELESLKKEYPNSPQVLLLVAAEQLSENQVAAARVTYARVSAIAPNDVDAFAALVRIDLATGKKDDALKRVDDGLAAMAKTGPLYVVAAEAYMAAGNAARAEELLKKAIEVEPTRLRAYTMLGVLYVRQNRLDEAERNFKETATRNPSSVSATTMLGMLNEAQGKSAEAEQQYRRVLGLDPTAAVAANNLAWIYVASGRNVNEAMELAKTAQQRLPDEPNVNDTLGWIYYHMGSYAQAITHLEASAAKDPKAILTQYHLGMAYSRYSEPEKARAALTKALASGQTFDGIKEARETLAALPK